MKLQQQLSRKIGSTSYPKFVVVISPDKIKEAGWKDGMELEAIVKRNGIILKPKK